MTDAVPKPRAKRKRSPRPLVRKGKLKKPRLSAAFKALWANPEWREKTVAAMRAAATRRDPTKNYRRGVPDGMRKEEADAHWAKARQKAQEFHKIMAEAGIVEDLDAELVAAFAAAGDAREKVEGLTEEQMASLALREAMVQVLSPLSHAQTRNQAIRTVLEWTKSKPASKTDVRVNNAEAWLASVVEDAVADTGAATPDA